jgi:hypothetical protein
MNFRSPKKVALLVAAGLFAGTGTAVAADDVDPAIARAQAPQLSQSQIWTYLDAQRAIMNTRREAHTKALAEFQSAISAATSDAQFATANDVRKEAIVEADAIAKAALAALARPTKHQQPAPTPVPTA